MLMRLMSKGEYLIVPKGTKFKGLGKLGLIKINVHYHKVKVHSGACKTYKVLSPGTAYNAYTQVLEALLT